MGGEDERISMMEGEGEALLSSSICIGSVGERRVSRGGMVGEEGASSLSGVQACGFPPITSSKSGGLITSPSFDFRGVRFF